MRRNTAILISVLCLTALLAGCQGQENSKNTIGPENQSSNDTITLAGISLGDKVEKVEQILGNDYTSEPLHPDGSWFGEPTSRWLYGKELEMIIGEDSKSVLQLNLYGNSYSTASGDKVGDKAEEILPEYEEKYPLAQDHFEGKELPGWFVVEEGVWLIFNFKDDDTLINQPISVDEQVQSIHLVYEEFMH